MPNDTRKLTRRHLLAAATSVAAAAMLAACGEDEEESPSGESSSPDSPADGATSTETPAPTATETVPPAIPTLGPSGHFDEVQVASNGTRHLIPLEDIRSGGPPKDGIPSIDDPVFVGRDGWEDQDLDPERLVLGVEVNGKRRAYPFQIMVWHELVNDTFEGVPILASYCPLCGSAIAFVREIETADGVQPVEFGVSGQLYNSDLLMYDRVTDTLWSQLTGTAVVGELAGQRLDFYPGELMTWGEWAETYPDSEVLTRDTGHDRNYDAQPYEGYDENAEIWFPVAATDDRLYEKTRTTGVELSSTSFGAYPDRMVVEHGPVNDEVGDTPLLVVADPGAGGNVLVFRRQVDGQELTFSLEDGSLVDDQTGSRWDFDGVAVDGELEGARLEPVDTIKGFWFAWFAFHPQTELWLPEDASE